MENPIFAGPVDQHVWLQQIQDFLGLGPSAPASFCLPGAGKGGKKGIFKGEEKVERAGKCREVSGGREEFGNNKPLECPRPGWDSGNCPWKGISGLSQSGVLGSIPYITFIFDNTPSSCLRQQFPKSHISLHHQAFPAPSFPPEISLETQKSLSQFAADTKPAGV